MGITAKPGMVALTGTIIIPKDMQADLLPLLEEHKALTRQEPGCLKFDVAPDADDPTLFHVDELFKDEAAFAHHQSAGAARPWGPASKELMRNFNKRLL
ncbi:putative quinol monooxygenase [Yoonia sp. BS5-3]|uniref:Quinol monooxygenase n=1 Tax=Yoonia phaeophyticola TaxID=3137369 RepID=A0ABZ2V0T0_9RHOB